MCQEVVQLQTIECILLQLCLHTANLERPHSMMNWETGEKSGILTPPVISPLCASNLTSLKKAVHQGLPRQPFKMVSKWRRRFLCEFGAIRVVRDLLRTPFLIHIQSGVWRKRHQWGKAIWHFDFKNKSGASALNAQLSLSSKWRASNEDKIFLSYNAVLI